MGRACKFFFGGLVGAVLLLAGATAIADLWIGRANPPVGRFIDTTSGRQHVFDVGPDVAAAAGAPTVVLLHGAVTNLRDMQLALLARLRAHHRVIAVDRPGHGWSERAGGAADATPRRQAAVLHEVLHRLAVKRPILLAHSWSGALALAYAVDYPDDVSGLVLLAPVVVPLQGALLRYAEVADAAPTPWLGALIARTVAAPTTWLVLERAFRGAFAPQPMPPEYFARTAVWLAARPAATIANAEDLVGLRSVSPTRVAEYSRIRTPTVIMTGTDDSLVAPRHYARRLARFLPHARLLELAGVGHMVHHARPDRIVAAVAGLVDDLRATARTGGKSADPAATGWP